MEGDSVNLKTITDSLKNAEFSQDEDFILAHLVINNFTWTEQRPYLDGLELVFVVKEKNSHKTKLIPKEVIVDKDGRGNMIITKMSGYKESQQKDGTHLIIRWNRQDLGLDKDDDVYYIIVYLAGINILERPFKKEAESKPENIFSQEDNLDPNSTFLRLRKALFPHK